MKKVLIAVDDTNGSKAVLNVFHNLVRPPEEVVLLHVERLEGKSMMIDMLGEAELSTLKESLKGTEYKEQLDKRAEQILTHYRKALEDGGLIRVKTILREGIPSEEICKVAEAENVDLIVVGSNEKRGFDRLVAGCVSKDVEKNASVPVIIGKCDAREKALEVKEAAATA
ncbi:MAG: universal stress protein [Nitrospiraceae bacterium]|nr:universal stress protein [Nitrospiraceae bacterium]